MANTPISGLTFATTPLSGAEIVPLVQAGVTKKTVVNDLVSTVAASGSVVASSDIGTAPNEIPLNQYLGTLAYQDGENIAGNVRVGGNFTVDGTVSLGNLSSDIVNVEEFVAATSAVMRGGSTNLLTYSEEFDNAAWVKSSGGTASVPAVTQNAAIAPDGTLTADSVVFALNGGKTSSDFSWLYQNINITAGATRSGSFYVKAASASDVGKVLLVTSVGVARTILLPADWQRVSLAGTASTTTTYSIGIRLRGNEGTADSATALIWGAQLNVGSTATPYLKTVADAVSTAYAAPIESPNGLAVPLLASMTPARRSDMTFELASNTSLVIKVKGSDGTVRSVALTLA